jgi:medium-chain acyl-[acyl-carrier-protein] hydrolase
MINKSPALVRFRPDDSAGMRLFCLHYAGGAASAFGPWTKHLAEGIELVAIQLPGREGRFSEKPFTRMDPLVAELKAAVGPFLDKPYLVFGHSLGAVVGFELLRAVRSEGCPLPELFIPSGHHAPQMPHRNPPYFGNSDHQVLSRMRSYDGTPQDILEDAELMKYYLPRLRADFEIIATYAYRDEPPLDCPIWAFSGREDGNVNGDELIAWSEQSMFQFQHTHFPGGHFFIKSSEAMVVEVINNECRKILRSQRWLAGSR